MTYDEVLEAAKGRMTGRCRVCRVCDGRACIGLLPGMGSRGSGRGFTDAVDYLASVRLCMDTLYEANGQDMKATLFGREFALPVFAAPIAGVKFNLSDAITEREYDDAVVGGMVACGCAAFTGDGPSASLFSDGLAAIEAAGGIGIPTLKPWKNARLLERIKDIERVGAPAFAIDIDGAGLGRLDRATGDAVGPKSVSELAEVAAATALPMIIKGVLTPGGALKAVEAGAAGIVVSSHGGRMLDDTPAPCSMLPSIRAAVGDKLKLFVDGGIRSGVDVFKALALGADAVLIGRPIAVAACGGGSEGVAMYIERLRGRLKNTMLMTGCRTLSDITRDKLC